MAEHASPAPARALISSRNSATPSEGARRIGEAAVRFRITRILLDARAEGGTASTARLAEALYPELRRVAGSLMRRERSGHGADRDIGLLALHDALERFAGVDARGAQVVELRVFGGATVEEIAHTLGVSKRTVDNDWAVARMWLARELNPPAPARRR